MLNCIYMRIVDTISKLAGDIPIALTALTSEHEYSLEVLYIQYIYGCNLSKVTIHAVVFSLNVETINIQRAQMDIGNH